jgi:hypothetical protein
MPRIHLFEWEDQSWFPAVFRNFITDHLEFHVSRAYVPAMNKLAEKLSTSGYSKIVDLCSGGGGPMPKLLPVLAQLRGESIRVTLTDLYPNIDAFRDIEEKSMGAISFKSEPISAMDCPEDLEGFRTIFTALHHFRPDGAKNILEDAMRKNVPVAAFEASERTLLSLSTVPLSMFVGSFLLTPFVGKPSIGRLFFTYVIPLAPIFFTWDAIVSCFRTYSPEELEVLTSDLVAEGYKWEIGQIPARMYGTPFKITYVIGMPQ